jgi:hypothetical protein
MHLLLVAGGDYGPAALGQLLQQHGQQGVIAEIVFAVVAANQYSHRQSR